jgi:hypothetical protein
MNIVVGSAFRNAAHRLDKYFAQVCALREQLYGEGDVRLIAAEGDSVDGTRDALVRLAHRNSLNLQLPECSHGGPAFGSTEAPERMKALSKVGNAIFNSVRSDDDVLLYVESDLLWSPVVARQILVQAAIRESDFDVFAPLIFAGEHFYDIWGYRKNGERFSPFPPYHAELGAGLTEVDSVGSCFATRSAVALSCRIRNDGALVDFCEDVRRHGFKIAVDPMLRVEHPC